MRRLPRFFLVTTLTAVTCIVGPPIVGFCTANYRIRLVQLGPTYKTSTNLYTWASRASWASKEYILLRVPTFQSQLQAKPQSETWTYFAPTLMWPHRDMPQWVRPPAKSARSVRAIVIGWPAPMLVGWIADGTPINMQTVSLLDKTLVMPTHILWNGTAVNGVVGALLGVVLSLVLTLWAALFRLRRLKRGLCPLCGYPRVPGMSTCSECGHLTELHGLPTRARAVPQDQQAD